MFRYAMFAICTTSVLASIAPGQVVRFDFDQGNAPVYVAGQGSASPAHGVLTGHTLRGRSRNGTPCFLAVDGVNHGLDSSYVANVGAGSWTLGFAINTVGQDHSLLSYLFDGGGQAWRIFTGGAAGVDGIRMRGPVDVLIPNGNGSRGWVHVAWVHDASAGMVRGYLNGAEVVSVPAGAVSITPTQPLSIGRFGTDITRDRVMLEDFRFYDSAITSFQLAAWVADTVGGGVNIFNTIPISGLNLPMFSSADWTGVAVIPAAYLDPSRPVIEDLAIAGLNNGTWLGNATIAIGHLGPQNPTPSAPFFFPGPHGATLGSFLDLKTVVDGPFAVTSDQGAWSPLGLRAGFRWNGTDDVGIYVTQQAAAGSTMSGVRSATTGDYFATAGFEAVSASSSFNGPKLRVLQSPAPDVTEVHIPDGAAVGLSNTIPFGAVVSGSQTYLLRIPASFMDADRTVIDDIAFLPVGSGTWSSPDVTIRFGHIQSPMPCPFMFGSDLQDAVTVHDGPLVWQAVVDTWSPLGIANDTFEWNGIDDVGVYLTFTNATVHGWSGGCWRSTNGIPTRTYDFTQANASVSVACDTSAGLKVRLDLREPAEPFRTTVLHLGSGAASQEIVGVPEAATQGWTVATFTPASPVGSGPMFGIIPDGVRLVHPDDLRPRHARAPVPLDGQRCARLLSACTHRRSTWSHERVRREYLAVRLDRPRSGAWAAGIQQRDRGDLVEG